jgi:TRAP-type uncharacterized transport system fused permease subunit
MEGSAAFITVSFLTAFTGTIGLSATFEKYLFTRLSPVNLLLMLTGSVLLLISNLYTDLAGVGILAIAVFMNYRRKQVQTMPGAA